MSHDQLVAHCQRLRFHPEPRTVCEWPSFAAAAGLKKWSATKTEVQRSRLLEALAAGPKTTYQLRRMGLFQAPTRVSELRDLGYQIQTARVTVVDQDGYSHPRVALYSLDSPDGGKEL